MFCNHKWETIGRNYNPPPKLTNFRMRGFMLDDEINKKLYGITVVTQRCTKCGKESHREVCGKVE